MLNFKNTLKCFDSAIFVIRVIIHKLIFFVINSLLVFVTVTFDCNFGFLNSFVYKSHHKFDIIIALFLFFTSLGSVL